MPEVAPSLLNTAPSATMVAYVQGYILALEDIMKDSESCQSLQQLLIRAQQSRQEAEQTLLTIAILWPQSLPGPS